MCYDVIMEAKSSIKIRIKIILKSILVFIFLVASMVIIYEALMSDDYYFDDETSDNQTQLSCNVVGINLHGELFTYITPENQDSDGYSTQDQTGSEDVTGIITGAEADDSIKAIILEIDSLGGSPVAGEEISKALKDATKPTVAFIRSAGDSSAYLAATGADRIFASKYSDVGSIGVTMSYLDYSKQNKNDGLTYNSLSSGKFKDSGDPDKNLSAEEKTLFMRDVNIMHQNLVNDIAQNRNLDVKKVQDLADGSTMLGEAALKNGLIDAIGGYPEVKEYLKSLIGEEPDICWE